MELRVGNCLKSQPLANARPLRRSSRPPDRTSQDIGRSLAEFGISLKDAIAYVQRHRPIPDGSAPSSPSSGSRAGSRGEASSRGHLLRGTRVHENTQPGTDQVGVGGGGGGGHRGGPRGTGGQ